MRDRMTFHPPRLSQLAIAAAFVFIGPHGLMQAQAQTPAAVEAARDYNIPAGPLDRALVEIAQQGGRTILFDPALVAVRKSAPVSGRLTVEQALKQALQGTNLQVLAAAGGGFTIRALVVASPQPASTASTAASTAVSVATKSRAADAVQLPAMSVVASGQADAGYAPSSTRGATRTDTPLSEIAQSVSVVTSTLAEDQQAQTMADMLRNVAGVQVGDSTSGPALGPVVAVRNYVVTNTMTDGMNTAGSLGNYEPVIAIDRVEVLKGPEGLMAGSGQQSYGGVVNIVTKKPQADPVRSVTLGVGQYGQVQAGADLAGAFGSDRRLTYRLLLSGDAEDRNASGYRGNRDGYFAPSVGWNDGTTSLVVGLEHIKNRDSLGVYTEAPADVLTDTLPLRVIGNREDGFNFGQRRVYYEYERKLNDVWNFINRGQETRQAMDGAYWIDSTLGITAAGDQFLVAFGNRTRQRGLAEQMDLVGKFSTGDLFRHTLMLSADYTHTVTNILIRLDNFSQFNVFTSADLPQADSSTPLATLPSSSTFAEKGLLIQDQIAIGERWHVLAGMRHAEYLPYNGDANTGIWLPKGGLVYQATPAVAVYASAGRGFTPRGSQLQKDGTPVPPEYAQQAETGLKFNLLDDRVALTTAFYRNAINHEAIQSGTFYTLGPGNVTEGIELELKGKVTQGLSVNAGYTHAKAKSTDGTPVILVSKNMLNLWADYRFQQSALKGWGVGSGLFARSSELGFVAATFGQSKDFVVPGQTEIDADVSYRTARWSTTLGVKNLTGRRLYSSYGTDVYMPVITRSILLTGKYDF